MKPTKPCIKRGEEEKENGNRIQRVNFSRYTVDMYGITTVKPPLTILGIS
jgi:hypothetical protein